MCKNDLTPEMADKALSLIKNIDWSELRNQKRTLINIRNVAEHHLTSDLEGILSLLDNVQDFAVDELGVKEIDVYDFDDEDSRD